MELHGAKEILSYTKFFEDGLLHLHPLYIESEQEAADSDKGKKYDRKNPQINTRRTTEKDPATGEKIIKSWQPLEDGKTNLPQYSSDTKNGGLPHFLCITSSDPSESPTSRILHKAMYNISEKMKDEMHEVSKWPSVCSCANDCVWCVSRLVILQPACPSLTRAPVFAECYLAHNQKTLGGSGEGVVRSNKVDNLR
jgi:hypothetical protein